MFNGRQILIEEIPLPASPQAAFCSLDYQKGGFLLESALKEGRLGRWSFLGAEPFLVFSSKGPHITLSQSKYNWGLEENPFSALRRLLKQYALEKPPGAPPLISGAVGYFGYDLCRFVERLPSRAVDDLGMPDCFLGFYDIVVAIDHFEKRAFVCSSGLPETEPDKRGKRAHSRLAEIRMRLEAPDTSAPYTAVSCQVRPEELQCNFTPEQYLEAVARAKEYIAAGDIYQVNLSQRFSLPLAESPLMLYRRLSSLNPAPFAGLLMGENWALVGASPERFLQVRGDWVETRPIKGTRPRGRNPEEDKRLSDELLGSEKDRAENVMIVDLERNDLGKVCEYGSVETTELWAVEKYPTVFHLVSTVEGRLRKGRDALSCLRASFPGGSITGAPKVRAMEIIEELEPTKRGPYTGAMGYLCFSGDMDVNIIIRTILMKDGWAHFQVGGGIVADSQPEAEYQETLDKGKALEWALMGEGVKS
jgi:para-aminobenzoate synthetase component 1